MADDAVETGKGGRVIAGELSETTALSAALAADLDGTFERAVLTYQGRLYGFALRLTGNRQDAEEVAQDTFVRAYRALQRFEPERITTLALRPWLYQIALNVVRNRLRGKRHRTTPLLLGDATSGGEHRAEGVSEPPDNASEGPLEFTARAGLSETLAALVAHLPERYRAAIILRHIEGLSYPEAAAVLGQPVGTVKANVHRGTKLLRTAWDAEVQIERSTERNNKEGRDGQAAIASTH